jgi:UDP-glucose 4-epimerase
MNRTLILGGAGFIGANLIRALIQQGDKPSIVELPEANLGRIERFNKSICVYSARLSERNLIEDIIRRDRITDVIHLVSGLLPSSDESNFQREIDSVVEPTKNLLQILREHGCRLVFFSSGGAIYGEGAQAPLREEDPPRPTSHYGRAKLMIEEAILSHSARNESNHLVIRPSNPYGRFQDSLGAQGFIAVATRRVLRGEELTIWGDGSIVRDYLHVDDLITGMLGVMNHPASRGVYNLGSGQGHRLTEVLSLIEGISGLKARVRFAPGRACDPGANVLDIRRVQALIPYAPRSLEDGLRAYVEEVKAHA